MSSAFRRSCAAAQCALWFAGAASLGLGQSTMAHGTITVGATKIAVQSVLAVAYTAPNGRLISVLLSDRPTDRTAFAERTRVGAGETLAAAIIEGAWKGLHIEKALSGFVFTIGEGRRIMTNEVLVGGRNQTFSLPDNDLVLELKSTGPRLTGRIRTKAAAADAGRRKVALDITFDAPIDVIGK